MSGIEINVKDIITEDYENIKAVEYIASLEINTDSSKYSLHKEKLSCKKIENLLSCQNCYHKFFSEKELESHNSLDKRKDTSQIDQI